MLNLGGKTFRSDVIFLQPTYTCGKNCLGCYSKENEKHFNSKEIHTTTWIDLIDELFHYRDKILVEQVTIALDTLPRTGVARQKMLEIARHYFHVGAKHKPIDMEAHFTVNCISDLREYIKEGLDFSHASLMSVSNINSLEEVVELKTMVPGVKINWNVLSSTIKDKDINKVSDILKRVDQMYLLLHKAPLGEQGHAVTEFRSAVNKLAKLDTSGQPVPENSCAVPSITDKIITDKCMADARKFKKTGHGCSSNISRFQIWPDGRVTGCAYNSHNQYGEPVFSLMDIIRNLHDARTRYEFNNCTIPDAVFPTGKKSLPIINV